MVTKPPKGADVKKKDVDKVVPEPLQDVPQEDTGKDIKQIFRVISTTGQFMEGYPVEPVAVINDYIRSVMEQGYTLTYVQHLRTERSPDEQPIGEQMLYVLVRQ